MMVAKAKDLEIIAEKTIISPTRLTKGGAAMLQTQKINHHKVMLGKILDIPETRKSLREWVISYVIPASANMADEQRPWEIIIIKAPTHPQ